MLQEESPKVLKSQLQQSDPYNIAPSSTTLKLSAIISGAMIAVLVGTLHYTLSQFDKQVRKLSIMNEACNNPNARVVTSEQALDIVKSLKAGGATGVSEELRSKVLRTN